MFLVVAFILWIMCGLGASMVAQSRSANGCLWFGLGVLFGPFGLAFAFAAGTDRRCPYCKEHIHPEALRCPRCQADLGSSASDRAEEAAIEDVAVPGSALILESSATASIPADGSKSIRYCNHCGGAVPQSAKFCNECGGKIIRALGETHA